MSPTKTTAQTKTPSTNSPSTMKRMKKMKTFSVHTIDFILDMVSNVCFPLSLCDGVERSDGHCQWKNSSFHFFSLFTQKINHGKFFLPQGRTRTPWKIINRGKTLAFVVLLFVCGGHKRKNILSHFLAIKFKSTRPGEKKIQKRKHLLVSLYRVKFLFMTLSTTEWSGVEWLDRRKKNKKVIIMLYH